jgi:toxin-antitoxin system PIN domain toxin
VILVDANILIYAHVNSFDQHEAARDWLDKQLNGSAPVGLPWASVLAFLRLVTNPRVFEHPESILDAWVQARTWLACETVWLPQPTERHADLLGEFLALPGVHGNLVPDAHMAALAVEHGLTLYSTDGDFARFRGLRWLNPIAN